ncbi:hypothetical protein [Fusobacterium mortiferum]|uniref:Uncharacterized protein n=1 Tax=Fusobacterium mortiferum ATCC 9817 TaxID=469616 RepID=A0ABM6TX91_FUSMR|nr:hypothetical protein [Fusobacterium mortiferum]AVQ18871.1 hypothetical protein C4N19_07100 [Fusobacterium mortiferum ATCC 9817]EEO35117.1 hypothetical protein FMAG_00679 [Fusobacterium mortiferum ATCC 9817]
MEFNSDNLEKYKKYILKNKKGYKFDNNISIYFLTGQWIFAKRNRIIIKNKDWEEFKLEVAITKKERKNGGKR